MHSGKKSALALTVSMVIAGCTHSDKPFIAFSKPPVPESQPTTVPVATSALGSITSVPGSTPKPKPFIALPKLVQTDAAKPSTLLLEHASADSPIPLSDYGRQPEYPISAFNLHVGLSSDDVQRIMGPPAQIADNGDPWLVYRIETNRELWLHFSGRLKNRLDAADVIAGVEDGYSRDRIFSADDTR